MTSALPVSSAASHVHFVGSACLPDTRTVFTQLYTALPAQIRRIPDGETGKRQNFVMWQRSIFSRSALLLRNPDFSPRNPSDTPPLSESDIKLNPLEYDDFAISSYATFRKLREEGMIPKGVRFQVSLPTPINVVHINIDPAYQATVEPLYTSALLACLRRIQDHIPPSDLAIQWDLASEFAMLEGVVTAPPQWILPSLKEGLVGRILQVAEAVDADVELGFHFCYGDLGHKHFVEPKDMQLLVDVANAVLQGVRMKREVNWIHMPVPKNRKDSSYYAPLKQLEIGETELYLGLLHRDDLEGTEKRISCASEFVGAFGVASECGLGRADPAELESILETAKAVTSN